ncbi:class I SAM-dependent methyltransferase [Mycobacterium conspicuum]|uniref:Uncharacterized protein n=1 Tax=Mycobacterium conspicuum TaxID=44010 RepID=A0A1X1SYQ4_9MYCO|nr:class I SAM-dependent methyltransferase [Mycobacterium conspicuum]ORV36736.1 hypothetical protein AWC00_23920 [Mycobacterium conspicuum]BBZ39201.1 hypothetical protein MCNS_22640 [Mycobacterium conspicuum]
MVSGGFEAEADAPSSSQSLSLQDMKRMKRQILRFLLLRGHFPRDGSSKPDELLYLAAAAQRTGARRVGEIGFNIGCSAYAFLTACPDAQVVSFDLGENDATRAAKGLIDKRYPNRHTLICGPSGETVPQFKSRNPDLRFDLVFIDGAHGYEAAKADIVNMKPFCTEKTAVVMDDLLPWCWWGTGPTQAWTEAIAEGIIRQDELVKDGTPVDALEPPGKRCWALGRYVFENSPDQGVTPS